jgi:hypothetical protein
MTSMCVSCGFYPGTIVDHTRTQETGPVAKICIACARREFPDVFPPPPKQHDLPAMPKRRRKLHGIPHGNYVPLDRPAR